MVVGLDIRSLVEIVDQHDLQDKRRKVEQYVRALYTDSGGNINAKNYCNFVVKRLPQSKSFKLKDIFVVMGT